VPAYQAERGLYSLTVMWRAADGESNKAPYEWLRLPQTAEFMVELEHQNTGSSRVMPERGRSGGTWAHWQV